jgi:diaminopimelate decarboxylase
VDVHIGSQILETDPYIRALEAVLGLVDRLTTAGIALEYVDLGGGFGVGYEREAALDLDAYAAEVIPALRSRGLGLILEPGRSIVGESGVLLVRVLYVKRSGGKTFLITDGGMTDLLRPALYQGWHWIGPVRTRLGAQRTVADVVGPICETGDFLGLDREMALPEPGDVLVVRAAGAYGFSMSSTYNARPRAAEVMVERGAAHLVRARETPDDLTRGEVIP